MCVEGAWREFEANMSSRLEGKVAIVTGAGRGIGRATAKLFAAEGAKVAVPSTTPANVHSVVVDIQRSGGTALGVICDIADPDQSKAAVNKIVAAYGGIDILVNNAFDPSVVLSSIIDLPVEQLQRNFETGPIACLRAREWGADMITVNNVLPLADTWGSNDIPPPTNALLRYGSPEEDVAPVVLFLASKDAQFLTGCSLTPDGGSIIDSAR
jgi:3-oxoacyl-[acyl-carrier protein] reductase